MTTALTGALGGIGAQLGLLQLGGPAQKFTYARSHPTQALPLIAHIYQNDGVTLIKTLSVLSRPAIIATTANGGYEQLTLELATKATGISTGNVLRLTEQGGDGSFIFGGVIEDIPDATAPDKVSHQLLVSPFAFELADTYVQVNYTVATDVSQMARDAFAATAHCSCDQISVPAATGITGMGDFRNMPAQNLLDNARGIAGANWYWFVDELGRGWFQPMGSGAIYTLMQGPDYQEQTTSRSIQQQKNDILVIGGIPSGSAVQITSRYTGASQSGVNGIGVRSLNPPIQVPGVVDQATLDAIAASLGAVLDQPWNRTDISVLSTFAKRLHGSQPGGGMVRYWQAAVPSLPESEAGGGFVGPYILQKTEDNGLLQKVTAGNIPMTNQTDIDDMVQRLARNLLIGSLLPH